MDLSKLPIDSTLRQSLSKDEEKFGLLAICSHLCIQREERKLLYFFMSFLPCIETTEQGKKRLLTPWDTSRPPRRLIFYSEN